MTPVDESDYFRLNPEFCHYLVEYRQTYFGDLSGEEARSIFRDGFVHDYNSACLDAKYYEGMESGHCGELSKCRAGPQRTALVVATNHRRPRALP